MHVAVVGTGHVGLTAGVCLASGGHQVICVDIESDRVAAINDGKAPFHEPGLTEMLSSAVSTGRIRATTELADAVANSQVTLITVGTPQVDHSIDLSHVAAAARQVGSALRRVSGYHVVALKSTVPPGTTANLVRNLLEEFSGQSAGEFGLCMNPEFLREGSAIEDFIKPDRIVIGEWDERSGQVFAELYKPFDCPKIFTTLANAEMIKYASNALLATLISFSNEIAALCELTHSADARVVLQGVHLDRRLTPMMNGQRINPGILSFLRAGCGFGGSCLPKDVNALRAYARERNLTPHMLDAVMAVNANRPAHLEKLAQDALGSLSGATITVLGLAFKPGTDDVRDSPALAVIRRLLGKGATVRAYDPLVTSPVTGLGASDQVVLYGKPEEALRDAHAAVVVTSFPELAHWDWTFLCAQMRRQVIIDGRNALENVSWPKGVTYICVGRRAGNGTGGLLS